MSLPHANRHHFPNINGWQVQKAIAQLKLAFDNLEKHKPSLSRDLLSQMFGLAHAITPPPPVQLPRFMCLSHR